MTRHRKNMVTQKLMGLALIILAILLIVINEDYVIVFGMPFALGVWMLFAKENVLNDKRKK